MTDKEQLPFAEKNITEVYLSAAEIAGRVKEAFDEFELSNGRSIEVAQRIPGKTQFSISDSKMNVLDENSGEVTYIWRVMTPGEGIQGLPFYVETHDWSEESGDKLPKDVLHQVLSCVLRTDAKSFREEDTIEKTSTTASGRTSRRPVIESLIALSLADELADENNEALRAALECYLSLLGETRTDEATISSHLQRFMGIVARTKELINLARSQSDISGSN